MKQTKLRIELAGREALLCLDDAQIARELTAAVLRFGRRCEFGLCTTLDELRERVARDKPCVVLVDVGLLDGASLDDTLLHLTESAPVVVLAPPERQVELARWVAEGDVEFIAKAGGFAPLAAGFLVRRLRWAERAESAVGLPWRELPPDFASILRHEINNPLTGILGNAELLLAHYRERLPLAALQRLETVVDLAVRLRETTRRLSHLWERQHEHARSA